MFCFLFCFAQQKIKEGKRLFAFTLPLFSQSLLKEKKAKKSTFDDFFWFLSLLLMDLKYANSPSEWVSSCVQLTREKKGKRRTNKKVVFFCLSFSRAHKKKRKNKVVLSLSFIFERAKKVKHFSFLFSLFVSCL